MKKIDFHIHTIPSFREAAFEFSLEKLKWYVVSASLDAIAITNHDLFDLEQFVTIKNGIDIKVFPGIEINVSNGHVLVIGCDTELEDFSEKAKKIEQKITKIGDYITVDDLISIYEDLSKYLVIPHLDKRPSLLGDELEKLRPFFKAGEVDSVKKFIRSIKDDRKPTPVIFSDARINEDLFRQPTRQTYIDCGDITLSAIKACLGDKTKVQISERDGNSLWSPLENGQKISTGLNVLIGARSSGKTHTLDEINENIENCKYIKQFELVQDKDRETGESFSKYIENKHGYLVNDFFSDIQRILDEVIEIECSDAEIDNYLDSLLRSAEDVNLSDAFSNVELFNETAFPISNNNNLKELIDSTKNLIENTEYREIIESFINVDELKRLILKLISEYRIKEFDLKQKEEVNRLVKEIKRKLQTRTSATQVSDVNFYDFLIDKKRIEKFNSIINFFKQNSIIHESTLEDFKIVISKGPFSSVMEIKRASNLRTAFQDTFNYYENPYEYLQTLKMNPEIPRSELNKLFIKITHQVINKYGYEISGGERSEFRLMQSISDAKDYDILLIDEPESSFDNIFLKKNITKLLKTISQYTPVVVVTHNNTVGASIEADYLLYSRKENSKGVVVFKIYSGYPTDKILKTNDGEEIKTYDVLMNYLEAGNEAYEARREHYEATKN